MLLDPCGLDFDRLEFGVKGGEVSPRFRPRLEEVTPGVEALSRFDVARPLPFSSAIVFFTPLKGSEVGKPAKAEATRPSWDRACLPPLPRECDEADTFVAIEWAVAGVAGAEKGEFPR